MLPLKWVKGDLCNHQNIGRIFLFQKNIFLFSNVAPLTVLFHNLSPDPCRPGLAWKLDLACKERKCGTSASRDENSQVDVS